MSELLSCPMCGGNNVAIDRCGDQYFVVCNFNNKGCGAASGYKKSENDAIKAWNTRPITPLQAAKDAFIEAYRKMRNADGTEKLEASLERERKWNHLQQIEEQSNGKE